FFFQAEDGIRDLTVLEFRRVLFRSGITNCCSRAERPAPIGGVCRSVIVCAPFALQTDSRVLVLRRAGPRPTFATSTSTVIDPSRSEERRVGKGGRVWGAA